MNYLFDTFDGRIRKSIVASRYVKTLGSSLLMRATEALIRLHAVSALCVVTATGTMSFDFISQIALTVLVTQYSHVLYDRIVPWQPKFYAITRYFIHNYTAEQYKKWKHMGLVAVTSYILLLLCFVRIDNTVITIYTVQNLFICIINDNIEDNKIQKYLAYFSTKPSRIVHAKLDLIEDYYEPPTPQEEKKTTLASIEYVVISPEDVPERSRAQEGDYLHSGFEVVGQSSA